MIEGLENVLKADSARSTKVDCTHAVEEYVKQEDWRINANANTGYSSAGLVNNLAGKVIANYWLDKVYSKKEGDAHRNGDYHIHDLDILGAYCFTKDTKIKTVEYGVISIADLLEKNVDEFTVYTTTLTEHDELKMELEEDYNTRRNGVKFESKYFVTRKAKNLRKTRENAELVEVEFGGSHSHKVRCTPDHKFLTTYVATDRFSYEPFRHFKWVEAKDLMPATFLNNTGYDGKPHSNLTDVVCADGSIAWVKSVTALDETEDVYCMEVDETHCFALENDVIAHNCCGHDLQRLLKEGFNGVAGRVGSQAPKHIREALYQMANFIGILQSEWAGAQAFSSFDTYLAPLVFFDTVYNDISYEDLVKAVRNFVYNLNVPSRWGQSPFSNVTLDLHCPNDLKSQLPMRGDEPFFVSVRNECKDTDEKWKNLVEKLRERVEGGKELDEDSLLYSVTYSAFEPEMRAIIKAYYTVMNEGDAYGVPFTFPIPTINITEDFDWDNPDYQCIWENTAKYGSSYFQNFIGSQYLRDDDGNLTIRNENAYSPNDVRSMCCRLQLDRKALRKRGGGLFGADAQTGSIGVVTINMARLGYLYKGKSIKMLIKRLYHLMDLAKSTLEKKRVFVQDMYERGLFPYTKRYVRSFDTFFSTIGINGMNECIRNFSDDKNDITDEMGQAMAMMIMEKIRARLLQYQEETGNLYNLEASPGEGTTYRFAKEDQKRYNDIIQAGVPEAPYYTNSSQLPANFGEDLFAALDLQDELQKMYTGGTVLHIYSQEDVSAESVKQLIKKVLSNYGLPYVSFTASFSTCPKHGRIPGMHEYCPKCDAEILAAHGNEEV